MKMISVLIPVYNRASIIHETIDSVLQQTYTHFELILVDNCSTDNTWEILQNYAQNDPRIHIYQNETNLGPVRNWQQCVEKASGDYIKIVWSDDLIEPTFLEKAIQLFDQDTAFVLSGFSVFESSSKTIIQTSSFQTANYFVDEYFKQTLLYENIEFPLSPGCAMFRTKDIRNCIILDIPNDYNIDFNTTGAGPDLLMMLLCANKHRHGKIKCINEILSKFRSHSGSISVSNDLRIHYEIARAYFIEQFRPQFFKMYRYKLTHHEYRKKGEIYRKMFNQYNYKYIYIGAKYFTFCKKTNRRRTAS